MKIAVKHMVCPRCISAVTQVAEAVGLEPANVELGEITLSTPPDPNQLANLKRQLESHGFALVETDKARLINKIKSLIIERIHHHDTGDPHLKLSAFLSQRLHYDYSHLSKLFSSVEAVTIERYATLQRVERAKELLSYDELTITEIAETLNYSSPAHLSSQFKQTTGMTPRAFRELNARSRRPLDAI